MKSLRKHTTAFLDCHLMVTTPEDYVKELAAAGASQFTFHVEATCASSKFIPDALNLFRIAFRGSEVWRKQRWPRTRALFLVTESFGSPRRS